jgi:hypothetical protein
MIVVHCPQFMQFRGGIGPLQHAGQPRPVDGGHGDRESDVVPVIPGLAVLAAR